MCGPKTNTTTTQTQPNANAMAAYQNLLGTAQGTVNNNPFQSYSGQFVAPVNEQQYGGIGGINQYAGFAQPYIQQAAGLATSAAAPIGPNQINQYLNPYTQQVVNATEAQFNNQNAQQQQQVLGNAALQGALGGDRTAVAQANLAGQQQLAQAPVIAGLYNQGYNTATQTALAEQQAQAQGAYSLGNLGVAGQQAGLTGAGAQIQAGTLEQQTQQQYDAALYNQFMMQQAFPYQQTQWLAGVDTGVGSQMGGTSQTTGPPPSWLAQALGLTTAGVGAATQAGAFKSSASGGRIAGFDSGGNVPNNLGNPLYGGVGFIPSMNITHGSGAPKPPSLPGQPAAQSPFSPAMMKNLMPGSSAGVGAAGPPTTAAGGSGAAAIGGAGGTDVAVSTIPEATAGLGAGVGAEAGAADLLPLLFLKSGGLVAPRHNQIRLRRDFGGPVTAAGFGTGSMVPRWPVQGYDDGGEVIDMGYDGPQEVSPEAMARWRRGVDVDIGRGATAQPVAMAGLAGDLPPEITQGAGGADGGLGGDGTALAYAGDPATGGVGSPVTGAAASPAKAAPGWFTPESGLGPALMAAGFGMMASRSPFPGVAIGEGGMQGLQTYSAQKQMEAARAEKQQELGFKQKHIDIEAGKLAQAAEHSRNILAQHTKEFEFKKEQADYTRMQPVKIGAVKDDWGNSHDVFGVKDPKTGEYHVIDPATGRTNSAAPTAPAPVAPGTPMSATAAPGAVATRGFEPRVDTAVPDVQPLTPAELEQLQTRSVLPAGLEPPQPARNDEFLKRLPPGMAATVKGLADYEVDPTSLSIKGGHREQLIGMTRQFDPTYDQTLYPAKKRAITEFYAGGPMSPAGTMTAGNTAIMHAAEMSDAIEKMKAQPGMMNWLGRQNIPFLSYWASAANNKAVQGTESGAALSEFNTARQRFSEEVTKFYSGSNGSQAEREHALQLLDGAKSLPELRAAIQMDAQLMKDKVSQLQNRLMTAMGPAAWKSAILRDPNSVLVYKNSQEAFDKIQRRAKGEEVPAGGGAAASGADPLAQARAAIAAGKDRNAVIQRLREHGINPSGL